MYIRAHKNRRDSIRAREKKKKSIFRTALLKWGAKSAFHETKGTGGDELIREMYFFFHFKRIELINFSRAESRLPAAQ